MFILAEMKNVTRIPPESFNLKLNDAIAGELNKKLANKVVLNVGLCIALFDILSLQESFIFPGDGASHTRVTFRYIVFRPFIEEILIGKIRSCSQEGVHVTLGFFDDILIPPSALQHPSKFNETEQAWVWEYDTGDGSKHDLFMDAGESIRFRVTAEMFNETCPTGPATMQETQENVENKVPYSLTVRFFYMGESEFHRQRSWADSLHKNNDKSSYKPRSNTAWFLSCLWSKIRKKN